MVYSVALAFRGRVADSIVSMEAQCRSPATMRTRPLQLPPPPLLRKMKAIMVALLLAWSSAGVLAQRWHRRLARPVAVRASTAAVSVMGAEVKPAGSPWCSERATLSTPAAEAAP